jgi:ATP-binding cassette subfamily F protein 3
MLSVNNLSKSFDFEPILTGISFSVNNGDRLGLVGPNGSGKTTLLRILTGEETHDSGSFSFTPSDLRIGYLPQGFSPPANETISSFLARLDSNLDVLTQHLEKLAAEMSRDPNNSDLHDQYDVLLRQMELAAQSSRHMPAILAGLGLDQFSPATPVAILSGGQKTRLSLASVLLSDPHLLLLDEPTNHLDLEMLAWLEDWLNNYSGAALVISHDRIFLDRTTTTILEIDGKTHRLRSFEGNYTAYLEQKTIDRQRAWQEYQDQQVEISRLRAAASRVRGEATFHRGGKADSGDKFAQGFFSDQSQGTVRRAKNIEARVERLLTTERVDKSKDPWEMKIEFADLPETSRDVVVLEHLSIGYGNHALLEDLNTTLCFGWRVALIGANGSGKTTLLRTIAGTLPVLAGRVRLGSNVKIGYMTQEQEDLPAHLNVLDSILEIASCNQTEARSFLSKFLFKGDDVFIPLRLLSYGERARLSLARLVTTGCNLLMLDEPINHLDIPARTRFEQALSGFDGTVLAVVHDRYFIEGFATHIWKVSGNKILSCEK